jgi:hypothetical protein
LHRLPLLRLDRVCVAHNTTITELARHGQHQKPATANKLLYST